MSLRFNTFRARRYLRTKFVEGRFLLASEASDIELELLDLLREQVKNTMGDVALDEAWKVEKLSDNQILIKPGEAWFGGLPFIFRYGKDQLVSGSILSEGIVPVGTTISDDPNGNGKIVTFNDSATTPTNDYRIVITAREELITEVQDPFLKNANLTESTAQKLRLVFKINVVPDSFQDNSPIPYTDENTTSGSTTNFPASGGNAAPNLVNEIQVTPSSGGNGEQVSLSLVTGSEKIDGRDLELVLRNDPGIGGGNPIPNGVTAQEAFSNGKLIDSNGSEFHITDVFNDNSTQVVIRIDKEPDQPNPEIVNGSPFTLRKKAVYVTDGVNGNPQGKTYWPIAKLVWNSSDGIDHESRITDLRSRIDEVENFQDTTNKKFGLKLTDGGNISYNNSTGTLTWSSDFTIINPEGVDQTIAAGSAVMLDKGALVYDLDLSSGGAIEKGTQSVTVNTAASTSSLASANLSQVKVGNVVVDSGGVVAEITNVDDVNDQITTSPALSNTGAATIYLDSFAPQTAKIGLNSFVLAVREGSKTYIGDNLELESGETSQIGDGISTELLSLFGTGITETTSSGSYSSNIRGTAGEGFQERLGALTDAEGDNQEDRSAYLRSDEEITWTGTQLEFSSDIVLEIINTKTGTTTQHTIQAADSPVALVDGESLWVSVDRTTASENLTVNVSGTTPIPAQTQANKDVFVLFKRVDALGQKFLHLPFTKQVLDEGQRVRLGASGSGSGIAKATFYDPVSTSLPTGASVTVDGVAGQNGDTVLFGNLSSGNNRVYELSGVGSSISWTAVRAFNNDFDPDDGDAVRLQKGDSFQEQLAVFNGTDFEVNDVVRFFDGVSGDFWELSSIKTTTINDNTTGTIFSVNAVGSENFIVSYSVLRGTAKETGEIFITSDGTNASLSRTNAYLSDIGVDFTAQINTGNLELNYNSDNSGTSGTMKYFVKRWSNSAGGPTGIPNYTGAGGGSSTAAAGTVNDIQFHGSSGNLDADTRFKWDGTLGAINMNGMKYGVLSSNITLNDNQTVPAAVISYSENDYKFAVIDYSVERAGDYRVGRMLVSNDLSGNTGFSDDYVETNNTGITFSASVSSGTVEIEYVSTSTGSTGRFNYTIRRWN